MPGRVSPSVLVASEDPLLLDEVVRYLEELPHWRLVGSARSVSELVGTIAARAPEAVVVSEGLVRELAGTGVVPWGRVRLVVVGRRERPEILRAALTLGARGFLAWPEERAGLRELVEEGMAGEDPLRRGQGGLVAMWGPKGGSGTSVLAAHLAGALAGLGVDCVLVDLDLDHGDQAAILGAEREPKSLTDLLGVLDELSPAAIESVAWRHPEGFRAILAPGSTRGPGRIGEAGVIRILGAVREIAAQVVVDLPSGAPELALAVAREATSLLLVVTPDLLALRRVRWAMGEISSRGIDAAGIEVVVNQLGSSEISVSDIEAVVGRRVSSTVRPDLGLLRAPGRGELARSGRRLVEGLARRIAGYPQPAPGVGKLLRRRRVASPTHTPAPPAGWKFDPVR
ncbi:MAG: AAA family ATPase [Actinomycetota bacterium]